MTVICFSKAARICGVSVALLLGLAGSAGAQYTLERQWGEGGRGNGQFGINDGPEELATDPAGDVYVVDPYNHRVQKFNPSGAFLTAWSTRAYATNEFDYPDAIAIDAAGTVYVAFRANGRIQKFSGSGRHLGAVAGDFGAVAAIAIDRLGNLYVLNTIWDERTWTTTHRLRKYARDGSLVYDRGDPVGGIATGLAVDDDGSAYVGAMVSGHVVKFDARGVPTANWDSRVAEGFINTGPTDVAIDAAGAVYTTSCYTLPGSSWWTLEQVDRLRTFSGTGTLLVDWVIGRGEYDAFGFTPPVCGSVGADYLAVDRSGNVYMSGPGPFIRKFVRHP